MKWKKWKNFRVVATVSDRESVHKRGISIASRDVWTLLRERMARSGRGKKFHPRYSIKRKKSFRNRITRLGTVVNVFPRPIAIFLGQGANWLNRTRLPEDR